MKALRRSLSPFRRRKTATDLLQDVRLFEESLVSITPISNAIASPRRMRNDAASKVTPDTSQESIEESHSVASRSRRTQQQRQSRSPFQRRKHATELVDDVRQFEVVNKLVAEAKMATAASSDTRLWLEASDDDSPHMSPTSPLHCLIPRVGRERSRTLDSGTMKSMVAHGDRRRSKSPMFQRKKAEDLIQDLRDLERSMDHHSTPSSPRFVPGESCRKSVASSPGSSHHRRCHHDGSDTMIAHSDSLVTSCSSPRLVSPVNKGRIANNNHTSFSRDECNESGIEHILTPPRPGSGSSISMQQQQQQHNPSTPPTPPPIFRPSSPSSPGSVASGARSVYSTSSRATTARSKSPYFRRKTAQDLVSEIRTIELNYATRVASFSECSAIEAFLPQAVPDAPRSPCNRISGLFHNRDNGNDNDPYAGSNELQTITTIPLQSSSFDPDDEKRRKLLSGRKSLLVQQQPTSATIVIKPTMDHGSVPQKSETSTASTDLHLTATPDRLLPLARSNTIGKISLVGTTYPVASPGQSTSFAKKMAVPGANGSTAFEKDIIAPRERPPLVPGVVSPAAAAATKAAPANASPAPPSSISLERHAHISDLSCPLPDVVTHHRSLGNDSVAEIQKALSKVQEDLKGAHVMGRKVSRVLVMKKLLEVAETIECQEDRVTVQRKLSRLTEHDRPLSDHSSVSSDLKRRGRSKRQPIVRSLHVRVDDSSHSDGDNTRDSRSSDSSFSEWLAKQEETKGHWQQILDMMGLSYLWFDDDDLEREWEEFTLENNSDEEDEIRTPLIHEVPFVGSKGKASKTRSSKKWSEEHYKRLSRRKREMLEEEQMFRELEQTQVKGKPLPQQPEAKVPHARINDHHAGDRLKQLGHQMERENQEVETKYNLAVYERKAREAAELRLLQAKLSTSKQMKDGQDVSHGRGVYPPMTGSPTATGIGNMLPRTHSRGSRSLSLNLRRKSGDSPGRLSSAGIGVETIAVPKVQSGIEDGILSLGSIDSHQFSKHAKSSARIGRRVREIIDSDDAELEETGSGGGGWTYTQKAVRRKNKKAMEVAAAHHDKRRVSAAGSSYGQRVDEDRSDTVKPMRGRNRNTRPPLHHR